MKPTLGEIENVIDDCQDIIDSGESKFRDLTYEQGALHALEWVVGNEEESPLE